MRACPVSCGAMMTGREGSAGNRTLFGSAANHFPRVSRQLLHGTVPSQGLYRDPRFRSSRMCRDAPAGTHDACLRRGRRHPHVPVRRLADPSQAGWGLGAQPGLQAAPRPGTAPQVTRLLLTRCLHARVLVACCLAAAATSTVGLERACLAAPIVIP